MNQANDDFLTNLAQITGNKSLIQPDPKQKAKTVNPYRKLIEESSSRHGVDPDFIESMMSQESSFNPKAKSNKDAHGLMQLIPKTAERFGVKDIYNPQQNIEGGVKYAKWLLDEFGGNVELALAGYNAGEGAVKKYGNKIPPYRETQDYVKKIRGNYQGNGYAAQQAAVTSNFLETLKSITTGNDNESKGFLDNLQNITGEIDKTERVAKKSLLDNLQSITGETFSQQTDSPPLAKDILPPFVPNIGKSVNSPAPTNPNQMLPDKIADVKPADTTSPQINPEHFTVNRGVPKSGYEFEHSGKLKLDDGTELTLIPDQIKRYEPDTFRFQHPDGRVLIGKASGEGFGGGERITFTEETPAKQPFALTSPDGRTLIETGNQTGLGKDEVRVRDISNDKGGVMIARKTVGQDGKESFEVRQEGESQPIPNQSEIQRPAATDEDYKVWLNYKNKFEKADLTDSPETKAKFDAEIKQADSDNFGSSAAAQSFTIIQQQPANQPAESQSSQQNSSPQTSGKRRKVTAGKEASPQMIEAGTDGRILAGRAGTVKVDLAQKPPGVDTKLWLDQQALIRLAPQYGLTAGEIREYLNQPRNVGADSYYDSITDDNLPEVLKGLQSAYGDTNVEVNVRNQAINEILNRRNGGQGINPSLRNEIDYQSNLTPEGLNRAQNNAGVYRTEEIDPLLVKAKENIKLDPFSDGTNEAIEAEYQRLKNAQLDSDTAEQAKADAEYLNENLGNTGAAILGGLAGGISRVNKGVAGIFRTLGIDSGYELFSKISQKSGILGEETGDDSTTTKLIKIAGAAPFDIARIAGLSRLPGGMIVGFAADNALQAAGQGDNLPTIAKEGAKGVALGATFGVAGRVGAGVESTFRQNAVKFIDAFPSNAAYKAANLTAKALGEAATIGVIAEGTFQIEKFAGANDQQAAQSAIFNAVFHVANKAGSKAFDKVYKIWKEGEPQFVHVDPQGKIKLLKGEVEPKYVDAEIITDPKSSAYKASETARNVTPDKPNSPNYEALTPTERIGTSLPPRELLADNPKRIERAQPEAVEKAATDSRALKIVENLQGKDFVSVEQLQKLTRYSRDNVIDSILTLYAARKVEIFPDNSVRLINDASGPVEKSLFEKVDEVVPPKEIVRLPKSPIETEISRLAAETSESSAENLLQNDAEIKNTSPRRPLVREDLTGKTVINTDNVKGTVVSQKDKSIIVDWENGRRSSTSKKRVNVVEGHKPQVVNPEKPKAQVVFKERENAAKAVNVFTERGTKASIEPKVIDSSDLLTSLDEGFPAEFQPRDRSRAASKAQISQIANKLNPEFLGDSPKASDGRPLVLAIEMPNGKTKYAVISGNGRSEGIRSAYALGKAESYRKFVSTKDSASKHNQPVYVGVLDPTEISDLPEFAKEANESATAQMSATEQAKADAERLDGDVLNLFVPSDDGTIHGAANRDFTRAFLQRAVPVSEQGRLVDADGKLNQDGAARVRNAIFARAFGDSEKGFNAISRMAESTDNNVKNITNGLLAKAGDIAALKEAAKKGTRHKELDISSDLATAMEKFSSLRENGSSVEEYLQQQNLFGAETSPLQNKILQTFDHFKRSPKAIREIVGNYLDAAEEVGNPNQKALFSGNEKIDVEKTFEAAVEKYESSVENQKRQNDLFANYPLYAKLTNDNSPHHRAANALGNELKKVIEDDFDVDDLKRASISPDGKINLEAFRLIAEAEKRAGSNKEVSGWYGVYLNPETVVETRKQLVELFGLDDDSGNVSRDQYTTRAEGRRFLREFDNSVDNSYGDAVFVVTSKSAPGGLKEAIEEEKAHRADYRVGLSHSVGKSVIKSSEAGRRAMFRLGKGRYQGASENVLAIEATAKLFVDGNKELGINEASKKVLRHNYIDALLENDILLATIEQEFENVSETAREAVEYARKREKERGIQRSQTITEQNESAGKTEISIYSESAKETRTQGRGNRLSDFDRQSRNIGSGILDSTGNRNAEIAAYQKLENTALEKVTQKDLSHLNNEIEDFRALYSKSETKPTAYEVSFWKTWVKNDRKTDRKDVLVNFRRAGLLTGVKTHLRNVASNAINQASEEAIRPVAVLADLTASAITGKRTVQFPSVRGVANSFISLVHADETFNTLNVENGITRAWNILKNGDIQELKKNQLEEMQSGVPLFDAFVNGVFRTLGAEDALFKVYATRRSLEEQAKTLAISESREKISKFNNLLDRQKWIDERRNELLKNPTKQMLLEAMLYADFTTFTNDNPISDWFRKVKEASDAGKFVLEMIVPYDRTPTNIVLRSLEHTPLGFAWAGKHLYDLKKGNSYTFDKIRQDYMDEYDDLDGNRVAARIKLDRKFKDAIRQLTIDIDSASMPEKRIPLREERDRLKRAFEKIKGKRSVKDGFRKADREEIEKAFENLFPRIEQQMFARSFGRAGLGSAALALGIFLAMKGILSGSWDAGEKDEQKEFFKRRDKGILNGSLKIGNRRYQINDTPLGKTMVLGASIFERSQKKRSRKQSVIGKGFNDISDVGSDLVLEQPLLNSLDEYFGSNKPVEKRVGGLLGSFVPTIVSDVADVLDNQARENDDLWDAGQNRIPVLREYNKKNKHPREPYLKKRGNRLLNKFDPFNSRPVSKKNR